MGETFGYETPAARIERLTAEVDRLSDELIAMAAERDYWEQMAHHFSAEVGRLTAILDVPGTSLLAKLSVVLARQWQTGLERDAWKADADRLADRARYMVDAADPDDPDANAIQAGIDLAAHDALLAARKSREA
jgi:hypothetical protein